MTASHNTTLPITVHLQYIKDLSFENPMAPFGFTTDEQPDVNIDIDIEAHQIQGHDFEVVLSAVITSKIKDEVSFILELHYAGVFGIGHNENEQLDEDIVQKCLFVDCVHILFPYVRQIISNITRDGGFPDLTLAPLDFLKLYQEKKQANASKKYH
ncbi:protein-export chaperone SecB [Rickettsiales endosymbiont of Peranema trichophorum]|uniref:protein-export chaperone SecB n=1 Tax=Rickettsiales endosymbiont of Peranema trichophorum TaxID=2486577 RepID=UPI001022A602|nr:protein-export chaperone SecB [Rickettsiales endosymbiont of Peranema trichophorum]RZI45246.1 protein-export chaperone SecB [Rickettsiales endosymbiont of Peranema trichophorum]